MGVFECVTFLYLQELNDLILSDITRIGKESGLHSFEQVSRHLLLVCVTAVIMTTHTHTHTHAHTHTRRR